MKLLKVIKQLNILKEIEFNDSDIIDLVYLYSNEWALRSLSVEDFLHFIPFHLTRLKP